MTWRFGVLLIAISFSAAACARRHMTDTHGRAFTAAFARQVANAASAAKPPAGLDSPEATIVAESYRRSLAPKGAEAEEEQVLLIAPQPKRAPLAPSVPKK